jgi:hypothetical protein
MYGLKVITHPPNWVWAPVPGAKEKEYMKWWGQFRMMAPSGI